MQHLRSAAEALRPGHRQESLELPESQLHKLRLMVAIRTRDWTLYNGRPSVNVDRFVAKEAGMIFREFLAPKTGCASYLFG